MTPAPISVERLAVSYVKPYGLMYPDPRGEFVRHSDYATLLHQLAEMSADLEREQGVREDAQRQLRAAERAREEAIALLRELRNNTGSEQAYSRIAAFLAASGGVVTRELDTSNVVTREAPSATTMMARLMRLWGLANSTLSRWTTTSGGCS